MGSVYSRPGVNALDRARWDTAYNLVCANSAIWESPAGLWVSGFDGINVTATLSSQFDIALVPSLSASGILYSSCGDSEDWCSVFTTVQNNSAANWDNTGLISETTVDTLTSNLQTQIINNDTDIDYLSGQIDLKADTTTVDTLTSNLQTQITNNDNDITYLGSASGNWESTYTTFSNVSDDWNTAFEILSGGDYAPADTLAVNYAGEQNFTRTSATVSGYYDGIDNELGNIKDDISFIGSASGFFAEQDWVHTNFVNVTGDTMEGSLDFNGNDATGINTLCATSIYSISSYTHYQDIQVSELSGFSVTGDVDVDGVVFVSGSVITP